MADWSPPPLYGSTFTLHRVSPLHATLTKDLVSKSALESHSGRFSDLLRGNVLRGVHVGLDEDGNGLPRGGTLRKCEWTFLKHSSTSSQEQEDGEQVVTGPDGFGLTEGVQVKLEYERATYLALLLRSPSTASHREREWHFPLLLSRMPVSIRALLLDYLADAFDTLVEPLYLSDATIGRALEGFIDEACKAENGLQHTVGDIHFSIGCGQPAMPSLKSLDIDLKREDVAGFRAQGRKEPTQHQHDGRGPFMRGFDLYLKEHLALNRAHHDVHITRVACGTFTMSRDGRVKMLAPFLADVAEISSQEACVRKGLTRLIDILLQAAVGYDNLKSSRGQ